MPVLKALLVVLVWELSDISLVRPDGCCFLCCTFWYSFQVTNCTSISTLNFYIISWWKYNCITLVLPWDFHDYKPLYSWYELIFRVSGALRLNRLYSSCLSPWLQSVCLHAFTQSCVKLNLLCNVAFPLALLSIWLVLFKGHQSIYGELFDLHNC